MATMPRSRNVARKSVSLLMELGLSKRDAAKVVVLACDTATATIWRHDPDLDTSWLADIATEALQMTSQATATASEAVAAYQRGVARWARDFDQGHSAQQLPAQH